MAEPGENRPEDGVPEDWTPEDLTPEDWQLPVRRFVIGALAVPAAMLAIVAGTGWLYTRTLKPRTVFGVSVQPAPRLETQINVPAKDPARPARRPAPDASVTAAKAEVAAEGLPGWPARAR